MADRSDEFRKAASKCLYLARTTSDEGTRAALTSMAQRWFDLANAPPGQDAFEAALRIFNEGQTNPRPAVQQQQQIQPKKTE